MTDEQFNALIEETKSYDKDIMRFDGDARKNIDFIPGNNDPKKDGIYVTIRCGYGGIYQTLNEWKNGKWSAAAADASFTIAYSREPIKLKSMESLE